MHKFMKTIVFISGAFSGVVGLLGIQSLLDNSDIAATLQNQTASAVVRNYGLLALGLVGIVTAMIRLSMADTQQKQDKRSDLFERFQKSSEMLDSSNIAVRQASLYTLAEIAKEQPDEFYIIVQSLFCGFLRQTSIEHRESCAEQIKEANPAMNTVLVWPTIPPDMQDAFELITQLRNNVPNSLEIEAKAEFIMKLKGVFMPGGTFFEITLKEFDLSESTFDDSAFLSCVFDSSIMINNHINRCLFDDCKMDELNLSGTQMRMTRFVGCTLSANIARNVDFAGVSVENTGFLPDIFGDETCPLPDTGIPRRFPHHNASEAHSDRGASADNSLNR